MPDERWERIKAIFVAASAANGSEREAVLARDCGHDVDLRREVESLLDAESTDPLRTGEAIRLAADAIGQVPAGGAPTGPLPPTVSPGTHVGPYKLLEQIGEGTFGNVWVAEQKPPLRRKVAIKIVKAGMDTREVLARFDAERQALAVMDHPNVAKVFDAGATDRGRPYFVMEHVPGSQITHYCDSMRLKIRDRLGLFIDVCKAVQHAHQKGIIHRDLKPGNILITLKDGKPVPKVIDFGIAKATLGRLTERTLYTETGKFIGTPEYMAPEQAGTTELDVDTRADVYSLGVLLYELLTGTLPFDARTLRQAGFDGLSKLIREAEPPKPSTRLSTLANEAVNRSNGAAPESIARSRDCEFRALQRSIQGDLDWITLTALEKDRARRYDTAAALAADVQRHLAGEPVMAAPPRMAYRVKKVIRKHRGLVLAVAVIAFLLVAGVAGTTAGVFWALGERNTAQQALAQTEEQRKLAEQRRRSAERAAEFMSAMLEGAEPSVAQGRDATILREMMDAAARRITGGELRETPEAELRLRLTLGWTYFLLAAYEEADRMLEPAVALARTTYGENHSTVAESLQRNAYVLLVHGQSAEALGKMQAALGVWQHLSRGDNADVASGLSGVADCLVAVGRSEEALPKLEAGLGMYQRLFPGDDARVATSMNNLAHCLGGPLGRVAEALPKFEAALAMHQRLSPGDHPEVARGLNNVAYCLDSLGRIDEALPKYDAALEIRRRLFQGDHPDIATSLNNVAFCLTALGKAADALPKYEEALQVRQRLSAGDHPHVALALNNVASCLESLGRTEEALSKYEAALEMRQRLFVGDHTDVAQGLSNLGSCLQSLGRPAEAFRKLEAAGAMYSRILPPEHLSILTSKIKLGSVLVDLKRLDEAERLLLESLAAIGDRPEASTKHKQRALEVLVRIYEARHSAEVEKGYDREAERWRSVLMAETATSQPSALPLVGSGPPSMGP